MFAGISAGFHDAGLSIVGDNGDILFASHSERYTKVKSDDSIGRSLVKLMDQYDITHLAYYERPWAKQLRQLYAGQQVDWHQLTVRQALTKQLGTWANEFTGPMTSYSHHLSHAAAGFQTSNFSKATVVVIDAVGEFDTISIYAAEYNTRGVAAYKKLWGQRYPHSIGLMYSAMTAEVGLQPLDEEYILMGMAAYGSAEYKELFANELIASSDSIKFKKNLHAGLDGEFNSRITTFDIAASAQALAEQLIYRVMSIAANFGYSSNLVYMGGVALNCLANRNLGKYFDNVWIMPSPGDAGSSLGAAALAYGKKLNWQGPYLGHLIPGQYPVTAAIDQLLTRRIVGVASGRAEFGPRALGNRSLLADPRGDDIKRMVNSIKQRQQFRPFAPVILEEHVADYFDMPDNLPVSPYMQVVAKCRSPELFPAIVHYDGTSRVQTVSEDSRSGIRLLLEEWFRITGCPMLLNTSLNIRGEPMVNDAADARRFEYHYGVKVCV